MGGTDIAHALPARAGVRSRRRPARFVLPLLLVLAALLAGALLRPAPAAAGIESQDHLRAAGERRRRVRAPASTCGTSTPPALVYDRNAGRRARPGLQHEAGHERRRAHGLGRRPPVRHRALRAGPPRLRRRDRRRRLPARARRPQPLDALVPARGLRRSRPRPSRPSPRTSGARASSKIRGRVLGDASWFDKLRTVPTWKSGLQLECGPLSALSGNQGLDNGNRVSAPSTWAAKLMTKALADAGIKVKGRPGSGKVPSTASLAEASVFGRAPRDHEAHEQGERQLLRRDAAQGPRQGLLRRGQHGGRAPGQQGGPARLRRQDAAPTWSRTGRGSATATGSRRRPSSRCSGRCISARDFGVYYDSLAVAGKDGTLDDSDARHGRGRQRARQDGRRSTSPSASPATSRAPTTTWSASRCS